MARLRCKRQGSACIYFHDSLSPTADSGLPPISSPLIPRRTLGAHDGKSPRLGGVCGAKSGFGPSSAGSWASTWISMKLGAGLQCATVIPSDFVPTAGKYPG